jgi:hypothetical protein
MAAPAATQSPTMAARGEPPRSELRHVLEHRIGGLAKPDVTALRGRRLTQTANYTPRR